MTEKICTVPESAEPSAGSFVTSKPKARPRGGSRRGVPNRVTADARALILAALHGVGGVSYLVEQARANPTAFLVLLGKLIPAKGAVERSEPPASTGMSLSDDIRRSLDIDEANGLWGRPSGGS